MGVLELLVDRASGMIAGEGLRVRDAALTMPYAYALIEGPRGLAVGFAYSSLPEVRRGVHDAAIDLREGQRVEDVLGLALSLNAAERVLGLAFLNAASQYMLGFEEVEQGAPAEEVVGDLPRSSKVALIGNMRPLRLRLEEMGFQVIVFERDPGLMEEDVLPDCLERRLLPSIDAVFISGSALVNDTLDQVLEWSLKARVRALVGLTAQQHPSLYAGTLVTHLASAKAVDPRRASWLAKLGAPAPRLMEVCVKYACRISSGGLGSGK